MIYDKKNEKMTKKNEGKKKVQFLRKKNMGYKIITPFSFFHTLWRFCGVEKCGKIRFFHRKSL